MENMSGGVYTTRVATLVDDGVTFQLDDYPIFAEEYRRFLNNKIIEHYMFYEIGYETVSLFNFALGRKMREIMPYYNQRYKSCMIEFEALSTQDATSTLDTTTHGTSSDTTHGTQSGTSSDTRDTSGTSSDTRDTTTHETDERDTTTHETDTRDTTTHETDTRDGTSHTDGTSSDTATGTSDGTSKKDETTSSDGDTSNTGTSKSRQVDSQFPQAALSNNGDYATSSSDVIGEQTASATSHATADKHETGSTHESTSSTSKGTTSSDGRAHEAGTSDTTTHEAGASDTTTHQAGASDAATHEAGRAETGSHEAGNGRTSGEESSTGSGIRDEHGETVQRLTGYSGVAASDLIAKYRETFLNIDMEIIYELRVLFMNIWDSGDNFERSTGYGFYPSYGFPRP